MGGFFAFRTGLHGFEIAPPAQSERIQIVGFFAVRAVIHIDFFFRSATSSPFFPEKNPPYILVFLTDMLDEKYIYNNRKRKKGTNERTGNVSSSPLFYRIVPSLLSYSLFLHFRPWSETVERR